MDFATLGSGIPCRLPMEGCHENSSVLRFCLPIGSYSVPLCSWSRRQPIWASLLLCRLPISRIDCCVGSRPNLKGQDTLTTSSVGNRFSYCSRLILPDRHAQVGHILPWSR